MSLSLALNSAKSGMAATSEQTAVVSRNTTRADDPYASRKSANLVTNVGGGVAVGSITRASDNALFANKLSATSDAAAQDVIVAALDDLEQTVGDPESDTNPSALAGKLADALQVYSGAPDETASAQAVVTAAQDLATALNDATDTVQRVREEADADMAATVDTINTLLSQYENLNNQIVKGTRNGVDVTDQLDQRDKLLTKLSEEIGIKTVSRADNDIAVYTDSGVTLFETTARTVTFERTATYTAATDGKAVYVDGVPITGASILATSTGRLSGYSEIRDDLAVTYQTQLDEIARGLVEAFAESDQSAVPTLPDVPGLFTYAGATAVPASGTLVTGLAGQIIVNPNVDREQGGDPTLVRDGAISGTAAYTYNSTGGAGYTDRLQGLIDALNADRSFDPAAEGDANASVLEFAATSVSWLEKARQDASSQQDYRTTLLERSTETLSNTTGINIDDEMTKLLDLERSYEASSKIISTINAMFDSLFEAAS